MKVGNIPVTSHPITMIKQPNGILGVRITQKSSGGFIEHHPLTSLNYIVKSKFRTKIGMDYDAAFEELERRWESFDEEWEESETVSKAPASQRDFGA